MPLTNEAKMSLKINTFAKFLDQPALIKKMTKTMPYALASGGLIYCGINAHNASPEKQKDTFIKDFSVLTFTVTSALLATLGLKIKGKEIFEGLVELPHLHKHDIEEILPKIKSDKTKALIQKVQDGKILKLKEVQELENNLKTIFKKDGIIKKIIPDAHNHGAFEELKKLSLLGLIPVLGGIAGGVLGDVLTKENWKKKFPDKVKEGTYQYLNNIFLCNVGAGLAMVLMNKLKVQSKTARFFAMLGGVIVVGLIAGSAIANFVGKNLINPLFNNQGGRPRDPESISGRRIRESFRNLNSERHPEAVDLSLHIDDIASVGFLSGMKWIGPVLPALYTVSGYRAGIGYRNGKEK